MFRTIDKKLYKIIGDICKKLFIDFGIKCQGDSGYCLRKIYGETRIHSDNIFSDNTNKDINKIRNMSLIINLNDNYEGGEFYFPIQNYKIKLKKGDIILFPPYWTHPHMVYSPINNTYRYTINTWLFQ
jgi:predicted 2-oxoglutarate/Fe(II)-dependent dioxygenase YbiX